MSGEPLRLGAKPKGGIPRGCFIGCALALVAVLLLAVLGGVVAYFFFKADVTYGPYADAYLEAVQAGHFEEVYEGLAQEWKNQNSLEFFTFFETSVQRVLGRYKGGKNLVFASGNSGTAGIVRVLRYNGVFENGTALMTFTLKKSGHTWRMLGVRYDSPLLLTLLRCPSLGEMNDSITEFCAHCGKPMGVDATAAAAAEQAPAV